VKQCERGVAFIDVVCATALCGVMAAMAVPVIGGTLDRERTMVGAQSLASAAQRARAEALKRAASVAVKLEIVGERTRFRLYADGNGNGVLQRDIDRGIDLAISASDWVDAHARDVSLRINQTVPAIGGNGSLSAGSDPLRIGNTSLLTFSPLGSSTSGTLYVSAPRRPQMAIRVYGATGRVRVLMFHPQVGEWLP
jgi:Tfp pilus assembly protein FimT